MIEDLICEKDFEKCKDVSLAEALGFFKGAVVLFNEDHPIRDYNTEFCKFGGRIALALVRAGNERKKSAKQTEENKVMEIQVQLCSHAKNGETIRTPVHVDVMDPIGNIVVAWLASQSAMSTYSKQFDGIYPYRNMWLEVRAYRKDGATADSF